MNVDIERDGGVEDGGWAGGWDAVYMGLSGRKCGDRSAGLACAPANVGSEPRTMSPSRTLLTTSARVRVVRGASLGAGPIVRVVRGSVMVRLQGFTDVARNTTACG